MDFDSLFAQLGFTRSQTKLYLAALSLGPASAIQLSRKLRLSRQMVYSLLPQLQERGLIKEIKVGSKTRFEAVDPEILRDILGELEREAKDAIAILKTRQAGRADFPTVTVYDTPLAMRQWYRQFIEEVKPGEEMLIWATNQDWYRLDPAFYERFLALKKKKKIVDRVITPDTPEARNFEKTVGSPYATYRYSTHPWPTSAEKWVWRNQIVYLTINENATNWLVVESENLAAIERFDFEAIWKSLPR